MYAILDFHILSQTASLIFFLLARLMTLEMVGIKWCENMSSVSEGDS